MARYEGHEPNFNYSYRMQEANITKIIYNSEIRFKVTLFSLETIK